MFTIFNDHHPAWRVLAHFTLWETDECVFWVRESGLFAFVSQPMLDLLGYLPAEMETMHVTELLADYAPANRDRLQRRSGAAGTRYARERLRRKDGGLLTVESRNTHVEVGGEVYNVGSCRLVFRETSADGEAGTVAPKLTPAADKRRALYAACTALGIVGASCALVDTLTRAANYASTDRPVLICGETGVGKESLAELTHRLSPRSGMAFERVNCGTVTDELAMSQLFGHKRGAFTGAVNDHDGLFARANGSIVFLDEVGELPLRVKTMLLRVLQNGTYKRLGDTRVRTTDVRIIAATNRDLRQMIADKTFREDLFHRLNVLRLMLPPLRERSGDLGLLLRHRLAELNRVEGLNRELPPVEEMEALRNYAFPGNVRELYGLLDRAYFDGQAGPLRLADELLELTALQPVADGAFLTLTEYERRYLIRVLIHCNWKVGGKGGAAALLGVNRSTLVGKLKRLGLGSKGEALGD